MNNLNKLVKDHNELLSSFPKDKDKVIGEKLLKHFTVDIPKSFNELLMYSDTVCFTENGLCEIKAE